VHLNLAWLDYFFVNKEIKIEQAQVITDVPYPPVFPSDHWPIMCDFEL
jgi:endonuclease/exonuclease/phosphatase family metal-dependent hydrolase